MYIYIYDIIIYIYIDLQGQNIETVDLVILRGRYERICYLYIDVATDWMKHAQSVGKLY